jgi:hypothetical protein
VAAQDGTTMTVTIRIEKETLWSITRAVDLLGRLHDIFDVDCQQQIDDLLEILESANDELGQHSVQVDRRLNPSNGKEVWLTPDELRARGIRVDRR